LDTWIPANSDGYPMLRRRSKPRRIAETGEGRRRHWAFQVTGAYLPRKVIWPGDDLAVRFSIRNDSAIEGTVYYTVTARMPEGSPPVWASDRRPDRAGFIATLGPGVETAVQVLIAWSELQLPASYGAGDLPLSLQVELWVPRRARRHDPTLEGLLIRWLKLGRFHSATLVVSPTLLASPPATTCFVSYAWTGS
jgi:hypothetical protein